MSVSLIDGHIDDDTPRMTDEQIVKALGCDLTLSVKACPECPYFRKRNKDTHCSSILLQDAIDLINRQKAEIESLKRRLHNSQLHQKETHKALQDEKALRLNEDFIKAEAVKEFAERLKKEAENVGIDREGDFLYSDSDNTKFEIYDTVAEWCEEVAHAILKEMVGDAE